MIACSCADPGCSVNGCKIAGFYRNSMPPYTPYQPYPSGQLITEEYIKKIIREELEKAKIEWQI